jgi:hypothetical protein
MTDLLDRRTFLAAPASLLAVAGCATTASAPSTRYVRTGDQRTLTISLWAGGPDQPNPSDLPTVSTVSGKNKNRLIQGPLTWRNPRTNEDMLVYERLKESRRRTKRQLLTVTHNGQGLGRVLDQRTGEPDRSFENDLIFPLGVWKAGEERTFLSVEHTVAGPAKRLITLKIRRLDFTYRKAPHSMRYDWTARDAAGRKLFEERYVYSPGVGLVSFTDRLKT